MLSIFGSSYQERVEIPAYVQTLSSSVLDLLSPLTYWVPSERDPEIDSLLHRDITLSSSTTTEVENVRILQPIKTEIPVKKSSSTLRKNLLQAKEIIQHVKKAIPYCNNFPLRSKAIQNIDPRSFEELHNHNKEVFDSMQRMDISNNGQKYYESVANLAETFGVGTCPHMAAVGCKYGKKRGYNVEIFSIEKGDHVFLVIGWDPKTDSDDYRFWGSDIVICDPWSGDFYPASELTKHLRDWVGTYYKDGKLHTLVRPFKPDVQKLQYEDPD